MRIAEAIALSGLLHGLIGAALVACLRAAPQPDVPATLDLSSVELSFAEEEAETAAPAPPPQVEKKTAEDKPPEERLEEPVRQETREDVRLETEDVKGEDARPGTEEAVREVRAACEEKPAAVEPLREEPRRRETEDKPREEPPAEACNAAKETPPPAVPKQARLDAPPRPKRNIRPDYPKGARQRGEQGEVVLEIRVNAEGTVDDVKVAVSSGFAELDDAAVRAAKAAKFSPARSGRLRVTSTARLKLQFKLR